MSAFSGGVAISFIADRSPVDAALADLRAQKVTIPVTFGSPQSGAGTPPTTFSSAASSGAPPTLTSSGIQGPATASSLSASSAAALPASITNQFQQAASQMLAAAQAMTAAASASRQYVTAAPQAAAARGPGTSSGTSQGNALLEAAATGAASRGDAALAASLRAQKTAAPPVDTLVNRPGALSLRDQERNAARYQRNKDAADFAKFKQDEKENAPDTAPQEDAAAQTGTGGSRRAGRIFGLRPGQLNRFLTAGYIAREVLAIGQAEQQRQFEYATAGSSADLLKADQGLIQKVQAFPIVGQLLGIASSSYEFQTNKTAADAERQDQRTNLLRGQQEQSLSLARRADVARARPGFEREAAQTSAQYQDELYAIRERTRIRSEEDAKANFAERQAVEQKYDEDRPQYFPNIVFLAQARAEGQRDLGFRNAQENADQRARSNAVQQAKDEGAARNIQYDQIRDQLQQRTDAATQYGDSSASSGSRAGQFTRSAERTAFNAATQNQAAVIRRERGGDVADAFVRDRNAQQRLQDYDYDRQTAISQGELAGQARSSLARGAGNNFGAQLNDIATQGITQQLQNKNVALIIPLASATGAQLFGAVQTQLRDFSNQTSAVGFQTQQTQAQLDRNPLQASLVALRAQRFQAQAAADLLPEGFFRDTATQGVKALYGSREELLNQQYGDQTRLDIFGLRARREENDIYTDRSTPRALAGPLSQVDSILRGVQGRVLSEFQTDAVRAKQLAPEEYATATSDLQRFKQEFVSGFHAQEINPLRADLGGAGSEDATVILKAIQTALDQLKNAPQTLLDIKNALGNLVAGP